MDPEERLTAEQALQHPFFERCEGSQSWKLTPRQRFRVSLRVPDLLSHNLSPMADATLEFTLLPFPGGSVDSVGCWTSGLKYPPCTATDQECTVEGPLCIAASAAPH